MKIGIAGANPAHAMLPHQHCGLQIPDPAATYIRQLRQCLTQNRRVTLRRCNSSKPGDASSVSMKRHESCGPHGERRTRRLVTTRRNSWQMLQVRRTETVSPRLLEAPEAEVMKLRVFVRSVDQYVCVEDHLFTLLPGPCSVPSGWTGQPASRRCATSAAVVGNPDQPEPAGLHRECAGCRLPQEPDMVVPRRAASSLNRRITVSSMFKVVFIWVTIPSIWIYGRHDQGH